VERAAGEDRGLLAKPRLVDLPENPVGAVTEMLRKEFAGYMEASLEEIVDIDSMRQVLGKDPTYIPEKSLHRIDQNRILRFDMTVPLLLWAKGKGSPLKVMAAGKVYRNDISSTRHLQVFHQLELMVMAKKNRWIPGASLGPF